MSSVEIASGAPEPIRVEYLIDGEPVLSSITVKADVRRVGGQVLDWSDSTFKAVGSVVQRYVTLTEDGASYPGRYSYTWDTSTITNAAASDVYQVMVYDGTEIIGMGEIRVGTVNTTDTIASDAAQAVDALYNARWIADDGTITQFADDGTTPAFTATGTDVNGDPVTIAAGTVARTTKLTAVP